MTELITQAENRIRPFIRQTPLEYSDTFSKLLQSKIHLKLENQQITGSFKARGACNKVLSVFERDPSVSIITASTGNHGLGTAYALNKVGLKGKIYLPLRTRQSKIDAIAAHNIPIELYGSSSEETEQYARSLADKTKQTYVSPYNDKEVIAGQATIGIELMTQLPDLEFVFVAIGGGGLISGIASYVKSINPKIKVIGCLPENASAMYQCIKRGEIFEAQEFPTLSESTAGGVEPGAITFEMCRTLVDDCVLVSEKEIGIAMKLMAEHHHQIIEGAAGVALAATLKYQPENLKNKKVAVIICGGNTDVQTLKKILNDDNL